MKTLLLIITTLILSTSIANAKLHKCKSPSGKTTYSQFICKTSEAKINHNIKKDPEHVIKSRLKDASARRLVTKTWMIAELKKEHARKAARHRRIVANAQKLPSVQSTLSGMITKSAERHNRHIERLTGNLGGRSRNFKFTRN